ncbi:DUF3830 family protein [Rhabdothermincola salaria]|uniref:DUF3830 family protein n=1 Tax=Rhabdothermincola salaria TaxID=2903142 RepID=UPI001E4B5403|nr:DUF3830 family protein [Rhabdothermincola salaria]MCD9625312.1 DUF3830 family protein [Rhabdothermincola salaria]
MPREIEVVLPTRGVVAIAHLLDDDAPRTCAAVWDALPLGGDIFHAKYARNELYTFVPPFAPAAIGLENPTITPIPGDLVYFEFGAGMLPAGSYGYADDEGVAGADSVIDLALFYGRNNLLVNGDVGWVPGNVFGTVVEGLDELAAAGNDVWRRGAVGESLQFRRRS